MSHNPYTSCNHHNLSPLMNIIHNKTDLINTIKLLIYKEDPGLFDLIDIEKDEIFLEPTLYSYFNGRDKNPYPKSTLKQILQGYFTDQNNLELNHSWNRNQISYLPQIGYFKKGMNEAFEPILKKGDFEIIKELHYTLEHYFTESSRGHIIDHNPTHNSVWQSNHQELFEAIEIIKKHIPDFYSELSFANSKMYLHDNSKILNFACIETLGMLFFYVIADKNLVYYIEELIHQGSHNYLYYVVHNRAEYFKIDVDNLIMRDYTAQDWDYRTIYSAFHGLFTVSQRLIYFDQLLIQNIFEGRNKHELLGRLVDQFSRLTTGLELLNQEEIYTEKGIALYNDLSYKSNAIVQKYNWLKELFDLSHRDLDFRYEEYCKLNPFDRFLKWESEGKLDFQILVK